jgi:hypothetical protein
VPLHFLCNFCIQLAAQFDLRSIRRSQSQYLRQFSRCFRDKLHFPIIRQLREHLPEVTLSASRPSSSFLSRYTLPVLLPKRPYAYLLFVLACLCACKSANHAETLPKPDRIVIAKSPHTLSLMRGNDVLKSYKIALGRQPVGPKEQQGDHRTPEGVYSIDRKVPHSRFHLALRVS